MKTRLLKRLRKNAKNNVFLEILPDGKFVVKSDIGLYAQSIATYYFEKKATYYFEKKFLKNVVFSMTLHEGEKILNDARNLYIRKQLMKFKVKKYQKIIKKL